MIVETFGMDLHQTFLVQMEASLQKVRHQPTIHWLISLRLRATGLLLLDAVEGDVEHALAVNLMVPRPLCCRPLRNIPMMV